MGRVPCLYQSVPSFLQLHSQPRLGGARKLSGGALGLVGLGGISRRAVTLGRLLSGSVSEAPSEDRACL